MSELTAFPSSTPSFGLPLLFSGQAQREFFVNQSLMLVDSVLQFAVDGTVSSPSSSALDGAIYVVGPDAADDWLDRDDQIALRISGAWQFVTPTDGMRIFDRTARQLKIFQSGWTTASEPTAPSGGQTIDAEARTAIEELTQALRISGIFPQAA